MVWVQLWEASAAYALLKSFTTPEATGATVAPLMMQPVRTMEGAEPEEPTSPLMVAPVQVTAPPLSGAALRTAKFEAEPSDALLLVRACSCEADDAGGADPQARERKVASGTRTNRALRADIAYSLVDFSFGFRLRC